MGGGEGRGGGGRGPIYRENEPLFRRKRLRKSRGPPQNPAEPRRTLRETPAEPSVRETPTEPSERQISSESLAEGCAPRIVTLPNFRKNGALFSSACSGTPPACYRGLPGPSRPGPQKSPKRVRKGARRVRPGVRKESKTGPGALCIRPGGVPELDAP